MKIRRALLLWLGLFAPLGGAAQDTRALGRLFHTPEERARLEAPAVQRLAAPRPTQTIRLDGIVLRSIGPDTVWINGQPVRERPRLLRVEGDAVVLDTATGPLRIEVGERARMAVEAEPTP